MFDVLQIEPEVLDRAKIDDRMAQTMAGDEPADRRHHRLVSLTDQRPAEPYQQDVVVPIVFEGERHDRPQWMVQTRT